MKYIFISYVALGLVLSLAIGIEYKCTGQEMFPVYYGSPFVFKGSSLGSSMQFFYSISGLILNVAIWSIVVALVRLLLLRLIRYTGERKISRSIYKVVVRIMIGFTTVNIAIDWFTVERRFAKGSNYWYMDVDKEAKAWGMKCRGELIMFEK